MDRATLASMLTAVAPEEALTPKGVSSLHISLNDSETSHKTESHAHGESSRPVAYVDPGNFATNMAGGSQFGYMLLWVVLAANLMAMLIQTLSAKLGIATGRSLPELCRDQLPFGLVVVLWLQAEAVAMAPKGTRNNTLNREVFSIARLVELSETEIENAMTEAALRAGLGDGDGGVQRIRRTITSALRKRRGAA